MDRIKSEERLIISALIERMLAEERNSDSIPSIANELLEYANKIPNGHNSFNLEVTVRRKNKKEMLTEGGMFPDEDYKEHNVKLGSGIKERIGQYKLWKAQAPDELHIQHYWASDNATQPTPLATPPIYFIGFKIEKNKAIYKNHGQITVTPYKLFGVHIPWCYREQVAYFGGQKLLFDKTRSFIVAN